MASTDTRNFAPLAAPIALFGIDGSGGIGVAANLLIVFLIAIWFALVFWTYADARRRLTDSVLIGSAALAALIFPFAGALVYAIVRPPETLDDAYERELDVRAAELRVRMLESAVKGGPASSAHSAATSAELSGEPTARRGGSTPPPEQARQSQPNKTSAQPRRTPDQGSAPSSGSRGGQPPRQSPGRPSRPSAPGADRA